MRFKILRSGVLGGLLILGMSLFHLQVIEGEHYRDLGEKNRIRLIPLEATRGKIYDGYDNILAGNRPSFNVVAFPEDLTDSSVERLSEILKIPKKEIVRRSKAPREYPFAPAVIARDVPKAMAFNVEERLYELPGVQISISSLRYYPYGETGAHVVGYIGKINQQEYQTFSHERFGMTSLIGRHGIEKLYDDDLRGWRGGRQIEVDSKGRLVSVLSEKKPQIGDDIHLTIDAELQHELMHLIEDKKASIAILDLETDGLIALASSPSFDPNLFVTPGKSSERLGILRDPKAPMLDRGVSSAYPPGSVFKLVTAIAALEKGKITQHTRFNCPGFFKLKPNSRPFRCWLEMGHGSVDLMEAIERSCNVYFYNLAKILSPDDIAKYARILGLGQPMELELSRIAPGLVPDSSWKKQRYKEKWYTGDTLSYVIGQSYLLTSPIQVLRLVSIIANFGRWVEPHLVKSDEVTNQTVAIKKETIEVVRDAMLRVTEADYGTGQFARVDFGKIAAKTGTAQVPPHKSHSWIAGFFPHKNPVISFVVFIEHGGSGGLNAARLAKDVLKVWDKNRNE